MEKLFQQRLNRRKLLKSSGEAALLAAAAPALPTLLPSTNRPEKSIFDWRRRGSNTLKKENSESVQGSWKYFYDTISEENKNRYGDGTYYDNGERVYLWRHYANPGEQDPNNYEYEIVVPVGKDNVIAPKPTNEPEADTMNASWYQYDDNKWSFKTQEFTEQVADTIRDIVNKFKDAGFEKIPKQFLYAHLKESGGQTGSKQESTCGKALNGNDTFIALASQTMSSIIIDNIDIKRSSDYMRIFVPAHEMVHALFNSTGVTPKGEEAIATAVGYMMIHDPEIKATHWATPQTDNPLIEHEAEWAEAFFVNSNLALRGTGNDPKAGYEHYLLYLDLIKVNNDSFDTFIRNLTQLPPICNADGSLTDYLESLFPNQSFPDIYAHYLARVLAPPGSDDRPYMDAVRTKLGNKIQNWKPYETIPLLPNQFKFVTMNSPDWYGKSIPVIRSAQPDKKGMFAGGLNMNGMTQVHETPESLDYLLHAGNNTINFVAFNHTKEDSGAVVDSIEKSSLTEPLYAPYIIK